MRVSYSIELGLANYIQSRNQLLTSIQAARKWCLHPILLASKQLELKFRDIDDNAAHLNLPSSGPSISLDYLTRIETTTYTVSKEKLRITLDIPLMDQKYYTFYKMHAVPVDQTIFGKYNERAYILPRRPYWALEETRRTHICDRQHTFTAKTNNRFMNRLVTRRVKANYCLTLT